MRFLTRQIDVTRQSDAELCRMLRGGKRESEAAFKEIYYRHAPRLHAYCNRIMNHSEEAADVFQETFMRFYDLARRERDMTNVPGFLLRIARNLCLNKRRGRAVHVSMDGIEIASETPPLLENEELLLLIEKAVELLDDEFREAFLLRECESYSYEYIAELTGTTVSNAKSRVFRARQKLKKLLDPNIKAYR
jgi:RNA polymerase sigma-70 factor (ECF subfamily)